MEEKHKALHSNGRKTLQELRNCPLVGTGQREAWLVFFRLGKQVSVLVREGFPYLQIADSKKDVFLPLLKESMQKAESPRSSQLHDMRRPGI